MLDIKLIRQQPDVVREGLRRRGRKPGIVDEILELDARRRDLLQEVERRRAEQKQASAEVAGLRGEERRDRIAAAKEISEEITALEGDLRVTDETVDSLLRSLPNVPHESVPIGRDEQDNVVVRTWGEPTGFEFEPKDHVDLGAGLGILDFGRGAKASASRFYYLIGDGALLEMALMRYALDLLVARNFIPVTPPFLVKPDVITGAWGGASFDPQQTYALPDDGLALIGTSEQSLAGLYMDEILEADRLPIRLAGLSWCFRREAGSYGRDIRGLYRVHQFNKVEMFSYCHPDHSWDEHEFLLSIEEEILRGLEIPYRVMAVSTGDLGQASAKTYDIEAWMPGRGGYGEVTSCSNTTDFQARRLRIRFRQGRSTELVHTLNGTAIATSRGLIAVLENFQQPDGIVRVPDVLIRYMNGQTTLRPAKA